LHLPPPFQACIDLIADRWDAVSASAEWKRLEKEMPELAAKLATTAEEWSHPRRRGVPSGLDLLTNLQAVALSSGGSKVLDRRRWVFC
jgi:hypothetical protein